MASARWPEASHLPSPGPGRPWRTVGARVAVVAGAEPLLRQGPAGPRSVACVVPRTPSRRRLPPLRLQVLSTRLAGQGSRPGADPAPRGHGSPPMLACGPLAPRWVWGRDQPRVSAARTPRFLPPPACPTAARASPPAQVAPGARSARRRFRPQRPRGHGQRLLSGDVAVLLSRASFSRVGVRVAQDTRLSLRHEASAV